MIYIDLYSFSILPLFCIKFGLSYSLLQFHSFIALCVSVANHAVFFFLNPLLIHISGISFSHAQIRSFKYYMDDTLFKPHIFFSSHLFSHHHVYYLLFHDFSHFFLFSQIISHLFSPHHVYYLLFFDFFQSLSPF